VTAEMMTYDAGAMTTVMCQNQMAGPTVIAADAKRNYEVIFGPKDDPQGEDVQPIPRYLLATPQFTKALRQGIFRVIEGEDDPVVQQALSRQTTSFRDRMKADELRARESIDQVSDEDLLVVTCIGPGSREGQICEEQIPVRAKDQGSRPPLCDRHQHLAEHAVKRGTRPWALEDMS
jgi:hypothetical protein